MESFEAGALAVDHRREEQRLAIDPLLSVLERTEGRPPNELAFRDLGRFAAPSRAAIFFAQRRTGGGNVPCGRHRSAYRGPSIAASRGRSPGASEPPTRGFTKRHKPPRAASRARFIGGGAHALRPARSPCSLPACSTSSGGSSPCRRPILTCGALQSSTRPRGRGPRFAETARRPSRTSGGSRPRPPGPGEVVRARYGRSRECCRLEIGDAIGPPLDALSRLAMIDAATSCRIPRGGGSPRANGASCDAPRRDREPPEDAGLLASLSRAGNPHGQRHPKARQDDTTARGDRRLGPPNGGSGDRTRANTPGVGRRQTSAPRGPGRPTAQPLRGRRHRLDRGHHNRQTVDSAGRILEDPSHFRPPSRPRGRGHSIPARPRPRLDRAEDRATGQPSAAAPRHAATLAWRHRERGPATASAPSTRSMPPPMHHVPYPRRAAERRADERGSRP